MEPGFEKPDEEAQPTPAAPALSKKKLKKLKRDEMWEAGREARKEKRKRLQQLKKERRRAEWADKLNRAANGEALEITANEKQKPRRAVQLPVSIIIDCGFDDLMHDVERKSLTSQITRCYSDNQKAPYRAHLMLSSFKGPLKERFDGVLDGQYQNWRGVQFVEGGLPDAIGMANDRMQGERGGSLAGAFSMPTSVDTAHDETQREGEVVYLSSDSAETLSELKPYSTYIVGGLVDRNRHKGVCFKAACDNGIRTAKLPIGDYMQMNSRFVLTVNQVSEILLRWLESGDWGEAFMRAIPKRKGGELKANIQKAEAGSDAQRVEAIEGDDPDHDENDGDFNSTAEQPSLAVASSNEADVGLPKSSTSGS